MYHHTQVLTQLVKENKLKLPTKIDKEVTFHDPCFLGRHNGEYDAPREVLESVAGLRLAEMEYSKQPLHAVAWVEVRCGMKVKAALNKW